MDPTLGLEELQAAIDSVVGKFLEELRLFRPPVDWVEVASGLSGLSCETENKAQGLTRKKAAAKGKVLLSDGLPDEQNQRIAAQAVAHTLMPKVMNQLGGEPGEKAPSAWTRMVVARLMVPPAWFHNLWRDSDGNFARVLKDFGPVPLEFLADRLVDGTEPSVVTVMNHGVATHRVSNGPRVGRNLLPLERECLEYVTKFSRARRMSSGGMTVWGWPIHISDWKKEILRTIFVDNINLEVMNEPGDGKPLPDES